MTKKTMGDMICALRKERGMTQRELADRLNVTDKAVSKWERNVAYPDTGTIPKLAELFGITIDELMTAKAAAPAAPRDTAYVIDLILRVIPLAMGVAVVVTSVLGELDANHGFAMLGLGMACLGLRTLTEHS